jgi:hypothetical protein
MSATKRVSVHVASDDLGTRLPMLLESLTSQSVQDWQAVVIDNSGARPTVAEPPVYILRNPKPQGLARSMGQAIELALSRWEGERLENRFVLLVRPDLILAPDFIERCLNVMDADPTLALAWPAFSSSSYAVGESESPTVEFSEDRILPKRELDAPAACVFIRASDIGHSRPDIRFDDTRSLMDFVWRIMAGGSKGREMPEAVAWLQPGATLASPGFLRYWTWVWTRRAPRS